MQVLQIVFVYTTVNENRALHASGVDMKDLENKAKRVE